MDDPNFSPAFGRSALLIFGLLLLFARVPAS